MSRLLHYRAQLCRSHQVQAPIDDNGNMEKPISLMYASHRQVMAAVENMLNMANPGDSVEVWKVGEERIGVFVKPHPHPPTTEIKEAR